MRGAQEFASGRLGTCVDYALTVEIVGPFYRHCPAVETWKALRLSYRGQERCRYCVIVSLSKDDRGWL